MLSGGGARGAYQVGVIAGILDVLRRCGLEHAPFNVLCGTSVGAINAGYLASHAERPDLAIDGLIDAWRSLKLEDHLKISLPLVGPILRKIILSRFASTFAMMYASGITVLDAIRSCEEIVGNKPLENALRMAGQQIADGKNTSAAFADLALFPPLVIRMLRIGEATGALDTALLNVSYFYNREVREAIGKLQAMIEPALTVVLGLVLGWVMLAVLGPVYDTISKMKF